MSWPGKYVRMPNKKTILTVLVTVSLLLYSLLSNKCLVNQVHSVFKAVDFVERNKSEFGVNSTHQFKQQPLVRLIPLITWEGNEQVEALFNATESKYLLLGKLGKPVRRLPDALIIGVKKGGTRALLDFIKLHPDVRAAKPEVHFFSRNYQKGLHWYREQMPPSLEGQITMEKSPSYFVTKDVPYRVWKMNSKTKLLVIVRDPVTRAVSDFTQGVSKKKSIEARSFESLAFVKDSGFRVVDTTWGPVRTGLYSRHLNRWLKFFPLNQMLFVSGERLIADPAAEMARVQDFLGLKRVITEKHFFFNSTKGFPCLMKAEGSSSPHCLGKTKGRKHVFVPHKALNRLRDFYRPFNLKFYQMTGINFGWP